MTRSHVGNLKILLGLVLSVSILGCESNDITLNKMYIKEIIDSHPCCNSKIEFQYENGRLISYKNFFNERIVATVTFTYQGEHLKLIQSDSDNGLSSSIELTIGNNGLREKEVGTYRLNGEVTGVKTINFFYDEEQHLKSTYYTHTGANYLPQEIEFEWANGNIIRKNYFYFNNFGKHYISSAELSFDNKLNYSNNDIAFVYINGGSEESVLSKNNLIKGVNTFEYNKIGYPIGYKYTSNNMDYLVRMNYE